MTLHLLIQGGNKPLQSTGLIRDTSVTQSLPNKMVTVAGILGNHKARILTAIGDKTLPFASRKDTVSSPQYHFLIVGFVSYLTQKDTFPLPPEVTP